MRAEKEGYNNMRISYLRTIICGVSILSISTVMAAAQDVPPPVAEVPAFEVSPPEAAPVAEVEELIRELPENMDPMSAGIVRQLDSSSILRDRTSLNLNIKLLEDQRRHQEALVEVINLMGVDGFKLEYPDLYEKYKTSPAVLKAEIKMHELKHELEAAIEGPKEPEPAPEPLRARDDGSDFFKLPGQVPMAIDGVPPMIGAPSEMVQVEPPPPPPVDITISLREVYGIAGNYQAIIMHGEEKIRVIAGDELPGETQIIAVGDGYIEIIRRGEHMKLNIKG